MSTVPALLDAPDIDAVDVEVATRTELAHYPH